MQAKTWAQKYPDFNLITNAPYRPLTQPLTLFEDIDLFDEDYFGVPTALTIDEYCNWNDLLHVPICKFEPGGLPIFKAGNFGTGWNHGWCGWLVIDRQDWDALNIDTSWYEHLCLVVKEYSDWINNTGEFKND